MSRTLRVIPSSIDAPLNMDKWINPLCTPRRSKLFINPSSHTLSRLQGLSTESFTAIFHKTRQVSLSMSLANTVLLATVQQPGRFPWLPITSSVNSRISYYRNNRKFWGRLDSRSIELTLQGWVRCLAGAIYLTCEVLCVVLDRVGYSVMAG